MTVAALMPSKSIRTIRLQHNYWHNRLKTKIDGVVRKEEASGGRWRYGFATEDVNSAMKNCTQD